MADRDDRSIRSWAEDIEEGRRRQRLIEGSTALVIGSDLLAQYVLGALAGLSVGKVVSMDNGLVNRDNVSFLCKNDVGLEKVKGFNETMGRINTKPDFSFTSRFSRFVEAFATHTNPDFIVDATNNPYSKESALSFAVKKRVPFISCSSDFASSSVLFYDPSSGNPDLDLLVLEGYEGKVQGSFSSGVAAGLVVEEIRKGLFTYGDNDLNGEGGYNLNSSLRNSLESNLDERFLPYFKHKKVLVGGGGALGNFVSLGLAALGVGKVDVLDFDTIENHNLNRQILLYGREGERKSRVLTDRLKEICSYVDSRAIVSKIGRVGLEDREWIERFYEVDKERSSGNEEFPGSLEGYIDRHFGEEEGIGLVSREELRETGYDVIFGGFDNKLARKWLSNFAYENGVPYIDGGTNPKGGQFVAYIPGKTPCVDCQLNLAEFPSMRLSCAEADPSVVMSNMVIGSAMVGEAVHFFYQGMDDDCQVRNMRYDVFHPKRIYTTNTRRSFNDHGC
tara:strand:+ start:1533 stop:3047 length:1515 start_codon:yes stop_codon:yes gene_type:complete